MNQRQVSAGIHERIWEEARSKPLRVSGPTEAMIHQPSDSIVTVPIQSLERKEPTFHGWGTHLDCFEHFASLRDLKTLLRHRLIPWSRLTGSNRINAASSRIEHMRLHGYALGEDATDLPASYAEIEFGMALMEIRIPWWREVVVYPSKKGGQPPWRVDYLILATSWTVPHDGQRQSNHDSPVREDPPSIGIDLLEPFYRGSSLSEGYRLIAVELDGPHHEEPRRKAIDAFKDSDLADQGVEVYRVSSAWAAIDPWATLAEVLSSAGFDISLPPRPTTIGEYICAICDHHMARWDVDWIESNGHIHTHSDCAEKYPGRWAQLITPDY